jgi:hypothetical protein
MPKNAAVELAYFPGTMPRAMNWEGIACCAKPACITSKELLMRNRIFAVAAIAGVIGAPIAAQAQTEITTGAARGGTVVITESDGITVDQRPAFREYVIRERVPTFTIPDRVVVGGVLPEAGITYYDVPQTYSATPYRYTVVNGQTVLIEPRTRRIVQVVD